MELYTIYLRKSRADLDTEVYGEGKVARKALYFYNRLQKRRGEDYAQI